MTKEPRNCMGLEAVDLGRIRAWKLSKEQTFGQIKVDFLNQSYHLKHN